MAWTLAARLDGTLDRDTFRDLCGGALVLLRVAESHATAVAGESHYASDKNVPVIYDVRPVP
jgi:hypothetical protein